MNKFKCMMLLFNVCGIIKAKRLDNVVCSFGTSARGTVLPTNPSLGSQAGTTTSSGIQPAQATSPHGLAQPARA